MIPAPLKKGDVVRIVAPARGFLPWMTDELKRLARERLESLGLVVTFGRYLDECDAFESTSIQHRVEDLHAAFTDSDVKLVLTVIGGYNSNQLLRFLDYDLIGKNPKRLCGFSDITALGNAIYAQTGLVTYSGPHFFSFGQKKGFEYTQEGFVQCNFSTAPYKVKPSNKYINGGWANDQDNPDVSANEGWRVLNEGEAEGTIIGGNLCTLNLLHGTEYMPNPEENLIFFIEDDSESHPRTFDRDLQSLLHQSIAKRLKGLIIGRFEKASNMTPELLTQIIQSKEELHDIPVIAGIDFGHTTPRITFPIGGKARMVASKQPVLEIIEH